MYRDSIKSENVTKIKLVFKSLKKLLCHSWIPWMSLVVLVYINQGLAKDKEATFSQIDNS
jgi:hypothetical protein